MTTANAIWLGIGFAGSLHRSYVVVGSIVVMATGSQVGVPGEVTPGR